MAAIISSASSLGNLCRSFLSSSVYWSPSKEPRDFYLYLLLLYKKYRIYNFFKKIELFPNSFSLRTGNSLTSSQINEIDNGEMYLIRPFLTPDLEMYAENSVRTTGLLV